MQEHCGLPAFRNSARSHHSRINLDPARRELLRLHGALPPSNPFQKFPADIPQRRRRLQLHSRGGPRWGEFLHVIHSLRSENTDIVLWVTMIAKSTSRSRCAQQPRFDCGCCVCSPSIRLQLIRHLGDAGLGAGFIAGLARAADADRPDGVVADVDRDAAAERDHVGELALGGEIGAFLGLLRPLAAKAGGTCAPV